MRLGRFLFITFTIVELHTPTAVRTARADDSVDLSSTIPAPVLFTDTANPIELNEAIALRPSLQHFAKRTRLAYFAESFLLSLNRNASHQVQLNLFDDVSVIATIDRFFDAPEGDLRAAGVINQVEGSCVVFVLHEGALAGSITIPGIGRFDVKPLDAGRAVVREIDLSANEGMGCGAVDQPMIETANLTNHPSVSSDGFPNASSMGTNQEEDNAGARGAEPTICPLQYSTLAGFVADDGSEIDIMFYYTAAGLAAAGSLANLEAELGVSITYTNNAYVNSGINTSLNNIRVAPINYVESPNALQNLDRLVLTNDGFLDSVHAERDQYGADLVCLIVANITNAGGVAYQLFERSPLDDGRYGFSVMQENNATLETLAHEVGHNFGCQHDRCNPQGVPFFDYGWGYRQPCPGPPPTPCSTPWPCTPNKDIMAYPPGMTVPYFSNPSIQVGGLPIGGTDEHGGWCDNSSAHNGTAFTLANFRPSVVTPTPSSRIYVRASASPGGNGASWETAFDDLQNGIGLAARARGAVTEIWVAAGNYYPDRGTDDRYQSFRLCNGVTIYGGFAGTESSLAERNVAANATILNGEIGLLGEYADNSFHVVIASDRDSTAVMDGVTIRNGAANGPYWPLYAGGGMLSQCTSSKLINCTIEDNYTSYVGGGVFMEESSQRFENCTLEDNVADYGGGAEIFKSAPEFIGTDFLLNTTEFYGAGANCYQSDPLFFDCYFFVNSAYSEFSSTAGIRAAADTTITIDDCWFHLNSAYAVAAVGIDTGSTATIRDTRFEGNFASYSGALEVWDAEADIDNCMFIENEIVTEGNGYGGALSVLTDTSTVTVRNSRFEANTGGFGGGALVKFDDANLHVSNCIFAHNYAWYGGGIWSDSGVSTFANCTFWGNEAEYGGAATHVSGESPAGPSPHNFVSCVFTGNVVNNGWGGAFFNGGGTNVTIDHCTVANNSAPTGEGGGIYTDDSTANITHSIIWGNSGFGGNNETAQVMLFSDPNVEFSYNDIQNWSGSLGGTANFAADPLMIDVIGGDGFIGTDDDNVRLGLGSPCIEGGDPAYVAPEFGQFDWDFQPRIMGCVVDIGASEALGPVRNSGDMNSSGSTDLADIPAFVGVALNGGTPGQICIADMNSDGLVNGKDVQGFTDAVIAP